MIGIAASCFIALALVTLVQGHKHEELLASGYEYVPGVGYYTFGTGRNWYDAQDYCMSSKARLAVINSEEERQAIVSFLSYNTKDTYVFGGFTNNREVQYVTTEGIPFKQSAFNKWETGKPSSSSGRCVGINTKTGELADLACTTAMSYICEHQLWTEYNYVEGIGYYKLHTEGKGWADAYEICESEGAHLLIVNSQAEADAVKQIYDLHPNLPDAEKNDIFYIGFRAVVENMSAKPYEGTYLTIFGTSVSDLGYVKWSGTEPVVDDNTVICGALNRIDATYQMKRCDHKYAFLCEKEKQMFSRK